MESSTPGRGSVSIAGLLSDRLIRTGLRSTDKGALMRYLVEELCAVKSIPHSGLLLDNILKREQGINTTLDTGLSLPHARVDGLPDTAAILGLPAEPVLDPKFDQSPIRAMLLFFSPNRPEAYAQQLQLLRSIALLFDGNFLDRLLTSATPAEALILIRREEDVRRKI